MGCLSCRLDLVWCQGYLPDCAVCPSCCAQPPASCLLPEFLCLSVYLLAPPLHALFAFFLPMLAGSQWESYWKPGGGQVALVFDCSYFAPAAHCSYAFRQNHRRNPHYCSDFIFKRKVLFKDVWLDGHVWLCLILDVTECVKDWNSHICMVNLEKKAKFKHSSVKLLSLNLTATCSGTP